MAGPETCANLARNGAHAASRSGSRGAPGPSRGKIFAAGRVIFASAAQPPHGPTRPAPGRLRSWIRSFSAALEPAPSFPYNGMSQLARTGNGR